MRLRAIASLPTLLALALTLALTGSPAQAQERPLRCDDPAVPVVVVSFVGDAWTDAFRTRVLGELTAALAAQEMAACTEARAAGRDHVAEIELRTLGLPRVAVVIEVRDEITQKRLARDLDLASFPEDGRALALAVASDELLRASWMELALADAPAPPRPPPVQVTRVVEREVDRARPSRTTLVLRGVTEAWGGGETHFGGDLALSHGLAEQVSLSLWVGARRGLSRKGQHGSVRGSALAGGLAIGWHPSAGALRPSLSLGLRAAQVFFEARADAGGYARDDGGIAIVPTLSAGFDWRLAGPFMLQLSLGGGLPVRGVAALDGGERVTGTTGFLLFGRIGAGWEL